LFLLFFATMMAASIIAAVEATLRLAPEIVNGAVANHTFGGYHSMASGIYERDRRLGYALKPACSCKLFANGHWWHHETNAAGFRGEAVSRADAVFLGDSMVYGHGVDNHDTVASRFQSLSDRPVANLGQQGTCLIQMDMLLRRHGARLQPRVVFVCSHFNDIHEAAQWYPDEELSRYVAEAYEPLAHRHYWPKPAWRIDHHVWNDHLAPSLRFAGAIAGWRKALDEGVTLKSTRASVHLQRPFVPSNEMIDNPFAPWHTEAARTDRLGWQAHVRALANIQLQCREMSARLILFDLGYPEAFSKAVEEQALVLGATYSPAGRIALQHALRGEDIYLANDGHWSANGSRVIASELWRSLSK
jgi:hypothetical protein